MTNEYLPAGKRPIDYVFDGLEARKMKFDRSLLEIVLFENACTRIEAEGREKTPDLVETYMVRLGMDTLMIADDIYWQYDKPIELRLTNLPPYRPKDEED